jgi:hypothetical protein
MLFSFARFLPSGLSICTTNNATEITIVDLTFAKRLDLYREFRELCAEQGSILPGDAQASWPDMAKSAKNPV